MTKELSKQFLKPLVLYQVYRALFLVLLDHRDPPPKTVWIMAGEVEPLTVLFPL
jgi:hypothetical protein